MFKDTSIYLFRSRHLIPTDIYQTALVHNICSEQWVCVNPSITCRYCIKMAANVYLTIIQGIHIIFVLFQDKQKWQFLVGLYQIWTF